jgi:hypothetical protein
MGEKDSLGYGFWSAANYAKATATNAKYLTVDGVDPIQEVWVDGLVPTSGNGLLGNVTLAHVKDGTYPIWSLLRVVTDSSGVAFTAVGNASTPNTLISDAYKFLSQSQPDFVPYTSLQIVRSHFVPPGFGVGFHFPSGGAGEDVACNGTGSGCIEAGGDVGGLVYSLQADGDYNADNITNTGNTGRRQ